MNTLEQRIKEALNLLTPQISTEGTTSHLYIEGKEEVAHSIAEMLEEEKKNEAVRFAEWVDINAVRANKHEWTCRTDNYSKRHTSDELYQQFLSLGASDSDVLIIEQQTMALSKEELLKDRYKVIADYPKSIHKVGAIYTIGINGDVLYCDQNGPRMSQYPHLFKKLDWWEDRKIEEMPEYLRSQKQPINHQARFSNVVIMCGVDAFWDSAKYSAKGGNVTAYGGIIIDCFMPATEEEYNAYLQSKH